MGLGEVWVPSEMVVWLGVLVDVWLVGFLSKSRIWGTSREGGIFQSRRGNRRDPFSIQRYQIHCEGLGDSVGSNW